LRQARRSELPQYQISQTATLIKIGMIETRIIDAIV
jgi:hypothetical protein